MKDLIRLKNIYSYLNTYLFDSIKTEADSKAMVEWIEQYLHEDNIKPIKKHEYGELNAKNIIPNKEG